MTFVSKLALLALCSLALRQTAASQNLPSPNGTPGYLVTDGKTMTWGPIVTGGSGALDCVSLAATCDIVTALVPLKATANVWTGANDFSTASFFRLPTAAGAPPAAACAKLSDVGKVFIRNDAKAPNSSFYLCAQTADRVFSWELPAISSASTTSLRAEAQPARAQRSTVRNPQSFLGR